MAKSIVLTGGGTAGHVMPNIALLDTLKTKFDKIVYIGSKSGIEKDIIRKKSLGYEKSELLSGTLHNQIGRAIIKRCNTDDEKIIANTVKNFTLPVIGTLGFDYAQVTKGGVKMEEISNELESKFAKNLFLAGEILDVDGECGGYNLHWAFASGYTVAEAIAKREK